MFTVVSAIANRHGEPHWVALLIGGLFGIAAGIITFTMPHMTAIILLYFIAFWAILSGVSEIAAADPASQGDHRTNGCSGSSARCLCSSGST